MSRNRQNELSELEQERKLGADSLVLFWRLLKMLGPYKWLIFVGNLLCIICMWCNIQIVDLVGRIAAREDLDSASIATIVGTLFLMGLVCRITGYSQFAVTIFATNRGMRRLRVAFFDKLQSLSKRFFDAHKVGWLVARGTGDMGTVETFVTFALMILVVIFTSVIMIFVKMIAAAPVLMLACAIVIPPGLMLVAWFKKRMRKTMDEFSMQNSLMVGYLSETIKGIRVVQAFSREDLNLHRYCDYNRENVGIAMRGVRLAGFFVPTMDALGILGIVSVMVFGVMLLRSGYIMPSGEPLHAGHVCSFILYMNILLNPVRMAVEVYNMSITASVAARRLFEVFDLEPDISDPKEPKHLSCVSGAMSLRNLSFRYSDETEWVLKDFDLEIEPGQTIALVGETGAGKTTTANLMARFYDPTEGEVLLDENNLKDVGQHNLHQYMGIVLQEGYLFSGTVLDNIRFRRPELTRGQVEELCRLLGTHASITRLPDSYDTEVHEGGSSVSIGQRQIISISRALAADPRVLILDEATSAVDVHTEKVLDKALLKLIEDRTTIIIAHRLSTIKRADRILVIGDGTAIEDGTHEELLAAKGVYYELVTGGDGRLPA